MGIPTSALSLTQGAQVLLYGSQGFVWKQEKSLHTKAESRNWHVLATSGQRALSPDVCKQAASRHVEAGLPRVPDIKDSHGIN